MTTTLEMMHQVSAGTIRADSLRAQDRGRLVAIETDAAVYIGYIRSLIFYWRGGVQVSLERNGAQADVRLDDDAEVKLSNEWQAEK